MGALDTIRDEGGRDLYPQDKLAGCATGLMLFCAAFLGRQDCVWAADAGITATAVDHDQERLDAMQPYYHQLGWTFEHGDVFEYAARRYAEGATYDLVNLDPPTPLFDEVAGLAELWCGLADKVVVVGTRRPLTIDAPAGWTETDWIFRSSRNGGAYWSVLEPC